MRVFKSLDPGDKERIVNTEVDVESKNKQNTVLIPNKDFGKRKFLHVGLGSGKSPLGKLGRTKSESDQSVGLDSTLLPAAAMRAANKQWVHPPEALLRGHIVYNVKFLGESEVDCPKGTDIVRDAIRKRKFNKHIQKAEGHRTPRVELTISADGVTVQDPKTKIIQHQYPLHRISYCADDKTDKRMFTFIAKAADSNQHFCYVFDSEKCSEEITLTIGQAFDLAYRRFLETQGKDIDIKKQYLLLQKKFQALEEENRSLKQRIQELEKLKDSDQVAQLGPRPEINEPIKIVPGSVTDDHGLLYMNTSPLDYSTDEEPVVGRRLENLFTDDAHVYQSIGTPTKNGTANGAMSTPPAASASSPGPILSPPPPSTRSRTHGGHSQTTTPSKQTASNGVSDPFNVNASPASAPIDPFGMTEFNPTTPSPASAIRSNEQELMDIQAGFSAGLSFGSADFHFSMDEFDPLNQS